MIIWKQQNKKVALVLSTLWLLWLNSLQFFVKSDTRTSEAFGILWLSIRRSPAKLTKLYKSKRKSKVKQLTNWYGLVTSYVRKNINGVQQKYEKNKRSPLTGGTVGRTPCPSEPKLRNVTTKLQGYSLVANLAVPLWNVDLLTA